MRQAMPEAMPGAMLNECSEQYTQRNATNRRNVRLQDNEENPHFGNRASGAVDNDEVVDLNAALASIWKRPPGDYERLPVLNHADRGEPGRNRELWTALVARDGARCWMCGAGRTQLVIDHLRPRSNFAVSEISIADRSDNLRLACWDCNTEKSNRDVPFVTPLPIVWQCRFTYSPGVAYFEAFCAEHRHVCRVTTDWPIAGLRDSS